MPPKRKSDAAETASRSKKMRANDAHASAVALVNAVLANPGTYEIPDDDDAIRESFVELATYAKALEGVLAARAPVVGSTAQPQSKTKEQLEEEAEKIRKAANSGIKKQMTWKPSCKTGSAKWSYDGICPDPEVFGVLMKLDGPPKFKMKKYTRDEFEDRIGDIQASVRYDYLNITSDVNVRWSETGEFKFSGYYGK